MNFSFLEFEQKLRVERLLCNRAKDRNCTKQSKHLAELEDQSNSRFDLNRPEMYNNGNGP